MKKEPKFKKTTIQIEPIIFPYPNVVYRETDWTVDLSETYKKGFCGCGKPIAHEDQCGKYCKDCWQWLEKKKAESRKNHKYLYNNLTRI